MNDDDIIQFLVDNDITTNISFGSQDETFEISIKLQNDSTFILSESCPQNNKAKKFNESQSVTYEELVGKKIYYTYSFQYGTLSKDNIKLFLSNGNNIRINDFKFMLANTLWYDTKPDMSGMLGLKLTNEDSTSKYIDFITQLRGFKIIDSFVFGLEYKDENNGFLYIGNYFHEFNERYSRDDLIKFQVGKYNSLVNEWEINIDLITSSISEEKIIIQENSYIKLYYEIGIMASPYTYHDFIQKNFFINYLNEGICKENIYVDTVSIFSKYKYIVCDKNGFIMESFPELKLYNSKNNFTFSFNYKDLFYEYKDKIYFLVVFPQYPILIDYWCVGKPFFKKYILFLNKDQKTIGLYEQEEEKEDEEKEEEEEENNIEEENNEEENEEEDKEEEDKEEEDKEGNEIGSKDEKKSKLFIVYIISSVFLIIVVILVLYYCLVIKRRRKLSSNELEFNDVNNNLLKD